jgi:hypothetical protein
MPWITTWKGSRLMKLLLTPFDLFLDAGYWRVIEHPCHMQLDNAWPSLQDLVLCSNSSDLSEMTLAGLIPLVRN